MNLFLASAKAAARAFLMAADRFSKSKDTLWIVIVRAPNDLKRIAKVAGVMIRSVVWVAVDPMTMGGDFE